MFNEPQGSPGAEHAGHLTKGCAEVGDRAHGPGRDDNVDALIGKGKLGAVEPDPDYRSIKPGYVRCCTGPSEIGGLYGEDTFDISAIVRQVLS